MYYTQAHSKKLWNYGRFTFNPNIINTYPEKDWDLFEYERKMPFGFCRLSHGK